MKLFILNVFFWSLATLASAQDLSHRMQVGLSADVLGATLGIGAQLHGSLRINENYRAFDAKHKYINMGIGAGVGFTGGAGMIGLTIPHYLTYGIARRNIMAEFGYAGIWAEKQIINAVDTPTGITKASRTEWSYTPAPLIGFRYTADSGFLFRANLVWLLPGASVGWIF